jgi:hypothetical protein
LLRKQLQRDLGVGDPFAAAEQLAQHGNIDDVWKLLDDELGIAVSTWTEVTRQVRCECAERGQLLEVVGKSFQSIVQILHRCCNSSAKGIRGNSKHLAEAANRERMQQEHIEELNLQLAEKQKQLLSLHSKVMDSGVSLAVSESRSRSEREHLEITRRLDPLKIFCP